MFVGVDAAAILLLLVVFVELVVGLLGWRWSSVRGDVCRCWRARSCWCCCRPSSIRGLRGIGSGVGLFVVLVGIVLEMVLFVLLALAFGLVLGRSFVVVLDSIGSGGLLVLAISVGGGGGISADVLLFAIGPGNGVDVVVITVVHGWRWRCKS